MLFYIRCEHVCVQLQQARFPKMTSAACCSEDSVISPKTEKNQIVINMKTLNQATGNMILDTKLYLIYNHLI